MTKSHNSLYQDEDINNDIFIFIETVEISTLILAVLMFQVFEGQNLTRT